MALTLDDLREFIIDSEDLDGDTEVVIAVQPSWPFEHAINEYISVVDSKIYLAEAGQKGYLPGNVAEEIGWR